MLAFLGVALVAVGMLGLLVGKATSGAFEEYLISRQTGDLSAMDQMMDEMMGPEASQAALEQMFGPAERAYLEAINGSLWLAGGLAALVAVALGLLLAHQISSPIQTLTSAARRLGAGDLDQRVPVRGRRDELGELAEAFNSMAEAVGRQEMLRRQMAADIAHELRTPLAVIQANLEAMLDGIRPLSAEEVADAHRETQLLSRLVTDLRDLSLAETGQLPLRKEFTDLSALVRTSVGRFSSRAEEKGVRLVVEAAEDSPRAEVDPDRVAQVLGNLLDNALRHTLPGGEVVVRLQPSAQRDEVRITIRDTGSGIPEEHLPNVFERFYRADRARTRTDGGSGIGLAVVRQLIEAHGGRVWAESQPGKGSTFGFVLLAAEPDTPATGRPLEDGGLSHNGRA
jgi:signal transduction histidine kinase